MSELIEMMLDKDGQRVNSAGSFIDAKGALLDDSKEAESSTVHSSYRVSTITGERSIELAFEVQHVLQSHIVTSQGAMMDMLSEDDKEAVKRDGKLSDEISMKYAGKMLAVQGEVLSKLEPKPMFKLIKLLFPHVIVNKQTGLQALEGHFDKHKSHVLPVLKEIIRVNDFLDLDMTALLT